MAGHCLSGCWHPSKVRNHTRKQTASFKGAQFGSYMAIYIYCIALQRANLYTIGPIPEPPKKPKTLAILALDLVYPGGPFVGSKPNCYLLTSTINTKLGQAETRNATSVHPTHGSVSTRDRRPPRSRAGQAEVSKRTVRIWSLEQTLDRSTAARNTARAASTRTLTRSGHGASSDLNRPCNRKDLLEGEASSSL